MNNPDTTPPKHWTAKAGEILVVFVVSLLCAVGLIILLLGGADTIVNSDGIERAIPVVNSDSGARQDIR